jgi:hypothetical protein
VTEGLTRRLFVEMVREEWRLHGELFGGRRFGAFPLMIALLVGGASYLLVETGTTPETILAGLHVLAFAAGLHTGSIGIVGRDAVQDLVGARTFILFSARTLPVSPRRLLGVFVLKDILFYSGLFLLPMALGGVPAIAQGSSTVAIVTGSGLLWATLSLTFVLGVATTLAGLGLTSGWLTAVAAVLGTALAGALLWRSGLDLIALTPYGVFRDPSLTGLLTSLGVGGILLLLGALTFDPTPEPRTRTERPLFGRISTQLGDPVAAKSLLDVHRSGGGLWKVLFSGAILLGVTAVLVDIAEVLTGVEPSVGISFGTVLGLTGFTTYNWLTTGDDIAGYLTHPLSVADVYRGKFRAFLVMGPAVALLFYGIAVIWRGGSLGETVVGAVLLVGVACYVFGVTVALTGLSPNEFLFDTVLFAGFGVALIVALVPPLVVGFVLVPVSTTGLVALALTGVVLAGIGIGLFRWSLPRWERFHRR